MSKREVGVVAASIILLLACGLGAANQQKVRLAEKPGVSQEGPAPTTRYEQQLKVIQEKNQAEREKLGLDPFKARVKYPDPEIKLISLVRTVPGGTVEVVSTGRFPTGVQGVFLTDSVELVKESATESEYRATIKVSPAAQPGVVVVRILTPVSGQHADPAVVYVGGKYEWNLKADDGIAVKLTTTDDGFTQRPGGYTPEQLGYVASTHRAELFRSGETKPYEVRNATIKMRSMVQYECLIDQPGTGNTGARKTEADLEKAQAEMVAEMEKLSMQMMEALSSRNTEKFKKIQARMDELNKQATADAMRAIKADADTRMEGTCTSLFLSVKAGRVEGDMSCGSRRLNLTGTLKFVGQ